MVILWSRRDTEQLKRWSKWLKSSTFRLRILFWRCSASKESSLGRSIKYTIPMSQDYHRCPKPEIILSRKEWASIMLICLLQNISRTLKLMEPRLFESWTFSIQAWIISLHSQLWNRQMATNSRLDQTSFSTTSLFHSILGLWLMSKSIVNTLNL